MKKQIIAAIRTYPVRAAFLLILLFLLGSVMHQALGQGNSGKRSVATNLSQVAPPLTGAITRTHAAPVKPAPNAAAIVNLPQVMPSIDGTVATAYAPNFSGAVGTVPTLPQSQLPGVPTNLITTLFASNNFGNPGGANYFDLTVASSAISVTALDINTAETVAFSNVRIYVLPGMTSVGHETNMALWTQVATGSGTGAGVDLPTHVTLSNPFPLAAGTLYGIAVVADPAITLHYTNGNGSNQNYSNADLSLVLGSTSNVPFTAPVFSPRVWNGTIYYDVGTPCNAQYTIAQIGGSIVPGTTDIGNHGDDQVTTIALPFPYTLYDQTFTSINLSSNGNAQFTTTDATFTNQCLPWTAHNYTIFPYWDDQYLVNSGFGIFTSVSGTAPNRIFNIEWRAQYFPGSGSANFELRLYEGQTRFDVIYSTVTNGNTSATAGVQQNDTNFQPYFCNGTGGAATGGQSYIFSPCGTCTTAWQNEPPMANARRNAATAVVGSNLYAITGFNAAPNYIAVNERFNGTSWTSLAPIPVPHAQSRGAAVGTNIYVPGGFNSVSFGGPLDTMQIYNTTANTWSAGMTLPAARSGVATAAFNGLVYVIGGYNPTGTGHNEVYIYNPGTNSYTTGAPMTATQGNAAGVLFNGEIYVVGGGTAPGAQYAYNPTTNMWRTIAVLPTTGGTCQSDNGFVLDNELWVVGCLGLPINQQVWIYNPGSNSWRAGPPYSVDHQGPGAVLFNGRGFAVGGGTAGGGSAAVESVGCPTCQFHVLIVYTDTTAPTQLQTEIMAEPQVIAVDLFDAQAGTPTLAQLQQYQIVVPYSNFPFLDGTTLGNNLADYVDGGGVVVQCGFSHYGPGQPYGVNGRWVTGNYNPYSYSTNIQFSAFSLGSFNAGHPLMAGVTMLNGDFANVVTPAAGATEVAQNNLGQSLVAFRPVSGGHTTVGVTAYVGSDATQSGDWGKVVVNAGRWLGGSCGPVPSSAVSRKVHGAFTGDINLPVVAIGGAVGIECRNGAGGYQMVVTFPSPVTVSGVAVTSGTGSATFSGSGTAVITVDLTGVTDAQRLGVTLANVNDGTNTGDVLVPMGVLIGDSAGTGNGSVNAGDVGFVKSQSGVAVGAGNFRADVAINGTINASDIGLVKANSGHSLPP